MKDLSVELAASVIRDREQASAEALRLAQLRDDVDVRLRLGLATFNAASLVALLSAAGAAPNFLASIGFTGGLTVFSLAAFTVGTVAAGVAAFSTQNDITRRAGMAGARVSTVESRLLSVVNNDGAAFEKYSKKDLEFFEHGLGRSATARWAQSISGGAWLAGVVSPLLNVISGFIH